MTIMNSGEFFVESGCISVEQLESALSEKAHLGKILLGEVLLKLSLVDQTKLDQALAEPFTYRLDIRSKVGPKKSPMV